MRALLRVAGLLCIALLAGCSFLGGAKLWGPESYGLVPVAPGLYVEQGADRGVGERLQREIEMARAAVRSAYGDVVSRPVVHACFTEACYQKFGGSTSLAKVYGDRILLSPRALDWHAIAHEWSHAELHTRLNLSAWWHLPAWFDEGVAVAVSDSPLHSEAHWEFLAASGVPRPTPEELRALKSSREWLAAVRRFGEGDNLQRRQRGEPEIRPLYAAAGHELRPWVRTRGARGCGPSSPT